MKISAQFATSLQSPEHIAAAEQLGYDRAWLFDTPHESPDVWMMLAWRPNVPPGSAWVRGCSSPPCAIPWSTPQSQRRWWRWRPAGSRSRSAPASWSYLADYVRAFRGLLGGAIVQWQVSRMQMLRPAGHAPKRPIEVPILISALGPKGLEVATDLGDGLFTVNGQTRFAPRFDWAALGVHGTVLADGEPLDSPRVQAAAGPGNALAYAAYEFGGDVTALPAGNVWLDTINQTPP